jgi:hypothetical protein
MIPFETMKYRAGQMIGEQFPLVMGRGATRIVAADDGRLSLLVGGIRVQYTWDRLATTWRRLLSNQTLDVDELGGGPDALGIVSLFAFLQTDGLAVNGADGLLVVEDRKDKPVHQYADMGRPTPWAPWRRKLRGG